MGLQNQPERFDDSCWAWVDCADAKNGADCRVFDLRRELVNVVRAFDAGDVPYALCGGLAVVLHGFPRATKDIDFLVLAGDVERAREVLRPLGYVLEAGPMAFRTGKPEEQHIHRVSRVEGRDLITIDLLLVGPSLDEVWATREAFELDGVRLVAASRSGLVKMKRMAGRSQDLADAERLESSADE